MTSNARGAGGHETARGQEGEDERRGNVRSAIRGCGNDEMRRGFDARPRGGSNGPAPAVETDSGRSPEKKFTNKKGGPDKSRATQP